MMHSRRKHNIKTYTELSEMVEAVKRLNWTLCTGFRFGRVLLLNDSTGESPDVLQEYAVIILTSEDAGIQVDSFTIDWMEPDKLMMLIDDFIKHNKDAWPEIAKYKARDHGDECPLCA